MTVEERSRPPVFRKPPVAEEELATAMTTANGPTPQPPEAGSDPHQSTPPDNEGLVVGGVTALRMPREVLFTKLFDIRPDQLPRRRPQNISDPEWAPEDDE
jgi:hypothetical protein